MTNKIIDAMHISVNDRRLLKDALAVNCKTENSLPFTIPNDDGIDQENYDGIYISDDMSFIVSENLIGKETSHNSFLSNLFSKCGQGSTEADRKLFGTDLIDIGYYPCIMDTIGEKSMVTTQRAYKGLPLPILDCFYNNADGKRIHATQVCHKNVLSIAINPASINDFKFGMRFGALSAGKDTIYNCEASVDTLNGHEAIIVKDVTTGLYFGVTSNRTAFDFRYIGDTLPNVTVTFNNDVTEYTGKTCIGFGFDNLKDQPFELYMSFNDNLDDLKAELFAATSNGHSDFVYKANKYWKGLYNSSNINFTKYPNTNRNIARALYNVMCMKRYDFMCAGLPNWGFNYIRDTAWVIYSLAGINTAKAMELLRFFVDKPLTGRNSFTYTGGLDSGYENTDNMAIFLLACGRYYKITKDDYAMSLLKPRIDECVTWFKANLDNHHVLAKHPHDYWDDYSSRITVANVKYESTIDILWYAALKGLEPIDSYAAKLADKLDINDFVFGDRLIYGIDKSNNNITMATSPQHIFAGMLLPDTKYGKLAECLTGAYMCNTLKPANSVLPFGIAFDNIDNSTPISEIWMPHLLMACKMFNCVGVLENIGMSQCEYTKIDTTKTDFNTLKWALGAKVFSWTCAAWLELTL